MSDKGLLYYEDYDIDNYDDSFEYSYDDHELTSSYDLSDTFNCGKTVLKQITQQIFYLILINFIYRLIRQTALLPEFLKHLSSSILGYLSTFIFFTNGNYYVILLAFISYGFLKLLHIYNVRRKGILSIAFQIITIFTCEIIERDTTIWQNLRGSALIISMKTISLAFDTSSNKLNKLPAIYEYTGYMLCPANIVLGPFVSYPSYCQTSPKTFKLMSLKVFFQAFLNSLMSIVFIFLSTCFLNYLLSDDVRFFVTYRDALIFRCSHYFVSFMSVACLIISGIDYRTSSDLFGYQVTRPLDIELPRSLVPVVISWNIPIHLWIKTYIFENLKRYGKFKAIILTYLISSSLHGLNVQLAAVLLSIGIFSYVEFRLRNLLAEILDACIAANKCVIDSKGCCITKGHEFTTKLHWVKLINFIFGVFTIVLLAYLGVLLDTSIDGNTEFSLHGNLKKWYDLNFFGHIIVLIWYIMYLISKN
ncbi:protein-serine O-palmitoleoyltransferase porcupine [Chironomus tepperi]|uniref:protein-serine O-palmitoleoyltransferase porcupine n=1 Tax=Chironomus tepperi TaxID=113505 RepID=UPI00391EE7CB